jgi:hypothetical protein
MFHHLTMAVRDRMIKELKTYWQDHPRYETLAKNIQGKYAFDERPQFGMVVKTSGASNVVLSPDNFIGHIKGFTTLAKVKGKKSVSIEWVKEDRNTKAQEGIYHIQVQKDTMVEDPNAYLFVIQRYVSRKESAPLFTDPSTIELNYVPFEDSLRIREAPSGRILGASEYAINGSTITLLEEVQRGLSLSVEYTSKDDFLEGPFSVCPDHVYRNIIPGIMISVGRWIEAGDEQIIVVTENLELIAREYGGRWDISVDIDLVARDVHSQADISDRTVVWLWSTLRPKLANMGLEMSDVSLGGEGEEVYDENGDDYFYTASISLSIQADWFIHFPVLIPIRGGAVDSIAVEQIDSPVVGLGNTNSFIQRLM